MDDVDDDEEEVLASPAALRVVWAGAEGHAAVAEDEKEAPGAEAARGSQGRERATDDEDVVSVSFAALGLELRDATLREAAEAAAGDGLAAAFRAALGAVRPGAGAEVELCDAEGTRTVRGHLALRSLRKVRRAAGATVLLPAVPPPPGAAPRGERPDGNSRVSCRIRHAPAADWEPKEWVLGDGTAPEGLEAAVLELRAGDIARVEVPAEYARPDVPADAPPASAPLALELALDAVAAGRPGKVQMPGREKLERARELRERGVALWKAGRARRAEAVWEDGVGLVSVLSAESPGDDEARRLNDACLDAALGMWLNIAQARLKRGDSAGAETACVEALDVDGRSVRAHFRRGVARIDLGKWDEAEADLRRARDLDPSARASVSAELSRLGELRREHDERERTVVGGLFERAELYDRAEAAPAGEAFPSRRAAAAAGEPGPSPTRILDVAEELAEIEDEEEEDALAARQAWYNQMIGTGAMRIVTAADAS